MKILAIIPARGGSKGVSGKNSKLLEGKPLIEYTVETALNAKLIDTVMVSTDDHKIADLAKAAGAEVPFMRPAELATDASPTIDTILHVLQTYQDEGIAYDAICLLQPTVPFRDSIDLKKALNTFIESGVDSLISMRRVPHSFHPEWVFRHTGGHRVELYLGGDAPVSRRQELDEVWHRDGSLYICKVDHLLSKKSLYSDKMLYFEMVNSPNINIDTMEDWISAVDYLNSKDA